MIAGWKGGSARQWRIKRWRWRFHQTVKLHRRPQVREGQGLPGRAVLERVIVCALLPHMQVPSGAGFTASRPYKGLKALLQLTVPILSLIQALIPLELGTRSKPSNFIYIYIYIGWKIKQQINRCYGKTILIFPITWSNYACNGCSCLWQLNLSSLAASFIVSFSLSI